MASRLSQIGNWQERVEDAGFNVAILSIRCGVSRRQLLRFVRGLLGVTPHQWMLRMRMERAATLLRRGFYVKEVSGQLRFKQIPHFCREFKRYYGISPGHFALSDRSQTRNVPFR